MPARKQSRPTLASIAKSAGVSEVTLRAWQREGVDVFNPSALAERVARMPAGPLTDEMRAERLRKLKADASLAELTLSLRRKELVEVEIVHQAMTRIGATFRAAFLALSAELPGELEGLSPGAMRKVIDERARAVLEMISSGQLDPLKDA